MQVLLVQKTVKIFKEYLCIFAFQTTKASHLKLVTELKVNAFLKVLRRFSTRLGFPRYIYTRNF